MALAVVLRTLFLLRGQFTPLQTNLSPYEVCASAVRTNNIAEYSAVIELLVDAISLGIRHLVVRLDS
jgi:ribonuclease HI